MEGHEAKRRVVVRARRRQGLVGNGEDLGSHSGWHGGRCGVLNRGGMGPGLCCNRSTLAVVLEIDCKAAKVETG